MKTFLDSGVLLTAWRGKQVLADRAERIMEDPARTFCTSAMVKLELMPKPAFFGQNDEVEFYQTHFDAASAPEPLSADLEKDAFALACTYGLAASDAINLASAIRQGAAEFVTSELPGKPMFRLSEIKVRSLHS